MCFQPVRKHGCGERDIAFGRLERPLKRWRHPPTGSPLCAGGHGVALVEREQKDEEPR
jgi:hypothetical protein